MLNNILKEILLNKDNLQSKKIKNINLKKRTTYFSLFKGNLSQALLM